MTLRQLLGKLLAFDHNLSKTAAVKILRRDPVGNVVTHTCLVPITHITADNDFCIEESDIEMRIYGT